MFAKYGIPIPRGMLISDKSEIGECFYPAVLKAQVCSGKRKEAGGIVVVENKQRLQTEKERLFNTVFNCERASDLLIEEYIDAVCEYYISFSYSTDTRGPVLVISSKGGSGIESASIVPIEMGVGINAEIYEIAFSKVNIPDGEHAAVSSIIKNLWDLFLTEYALLAEINPLIKTKDGIFVAGDAKIILDDDKVSPNKRRFLDLGGDIAILASGGGASLLNIDSLIQHGGRPANYTEYSGNPPADVVKELTKRVLSKPHLRGCWVIGGTANFTDIFETMKGFIEGLSEVRPKPVFPIVIRRDGPRQQEAFAALQEVADKEGYQFYLFSGDTPMEESARIMVKLAYS